MSAEPERAKDPRLLAEGFLDIGGALAPIRALTGAALGGSSDAALDAE